MLNLDLSDVKKSDAPTQERTLLPEGKYEVSVTGAQVKSTKAGTGQYISMELTVQDKDHKGRKVWHNFNIKNPSEKAVEIGKQQLVDFLVSAKSKIAETKLESVTQLLGLRCTAKIIIEESEQYGDKNRVHYFEQTPVESEVHPGVENEAPQFSADEDLPF